MRRVIAGLLVTTISTATACSDLPDVITPATSPSTAAAPAAPRAGPYQQLPSFQPGVVVARFRPGADAAAIATAQGARIERELRLGMKILRVPEGRERTLVEALSANPNVERVELSVPRTLGIPCKVADGDCSVPGDALFGRRWDLHNDGVIRDSQGNVLETVGPVPDADTDWLEAFDQLGQFSGGAVVGLVDTGIFGSHPDLAGRLIAQHDFFDVDDIAEDDIGHGTHVAGIALALGDNDIGAAGIAWGPNVKLMVAKGCGYALFLGYICWSPDIADGIAWLVDQGANVINLSLGADQDSGFEQDALQYALAHDVLPVCAAGNDGLAVDYPAALPECMAVSATDWADHRSSYSSAGPEVEVSAPGGDTINVNGYDMIASTWNDGGYVYAAGTSMAAPQVTGLAALLHALGVTSAADKRALIRSTAHDLGLPGFDWLYGDGRIDVWSAVQAALGGGPPNQPPTAAFTADCTDLACDFTDQSSDGDGSVDEWDWDFGDGTAHSAASSPSHTYAAGGTYTVLLTVTDDDGATDSQQQDVMVTEPSPSNEPPTADFTWTCSDLACDFTDQSSDGDGSVDEWDWDFGDGGTSTMQSPSHEYATEGTYTVMLTVTDDDGATDTSQHDVTVTAPAPGGITLTAYGFKEKGRHVVVLAWSGQSSARVDIIRGGGVIANVPATPSSYQDNTGGKGKATYVYQVCEAGTTTCSDEVSVVF